MWSKVQHFIEVGLDFLAMVGRYMLAGLLATLAAASIIAIYIGIWTDWRWLVTGAMTLGFLILIAAVAVAK